MTDASNRRSVLYERADALVRQADALRREAEDLFPLSDEEKADQEDRLDDQAFGALLQRVLENVRGQPGITAPQLAETMGLPDSYPSHGSNYFTLQLLHFLENIGVVSCYRGRKPFEWTASVEKVPAPTLRRVK
jgi:hypothetical protein